MSDTFDLAIRNGTVMDPAVDRRVVADVAIRNGRIAEVARPLSGEAQEVIDATGLFIVPGLVDLHTHVLTDFTRLGVDADATCLARSVTTAVDAGSAGANTLAGFQRYIIERAETRVLAFLNISAMGLIDDELGELADIRWAMVDRAVAVGRANADVIVGIKVRLSEMLVGSNAMTALERSMQVANELGLPVMIHIGGLGRPLGEVLNEMRPGDIVTHSFTGWGPGIIGSDGRLIGEAIDARQRGVLFDVGHGAGSFSFEVAERALEHGFAPDTISTDIHTQNVGGPVFDLVTTLSKFLHLGMSIDDVISSATVAPARAIGRSTDFGTLQVGSEADVALLRLEEGRFAFTDATGVTRIGSQRVVPVMTLRRGRRLTH